MRLQYRKGSLLEYNGVYLAEGPWPGKAYFDALRRARQRDASLYFNYGFTRPSVISRGPHPQHAGTSSGGVYEGPATPDPAGPTTLPSPMEELPAEEAMPATPEPQLEGAATEAEPATLEVIEPLPAVTENPGPAAALSAPAGPTPTGAPTTTSVGDRIPNPFVRLANYSVAERPTSAENPGPSPPQVPRAIVDEPIIPNAMPWAGAAYEYQPDDSTVQVAGGAPGR
jgi:hypothetical protein